MIKQFIRKQIKIAKGVLNTYVKPKGKIYNDAVWWDESFYADGVSDAKTIFQKKSIFSAKHHYNSIEMLILRHLHNNEINFDNAAVLDIGSGAGHWIDFYKSLGASTIVGVDVSLSSTEYLKNKYLNQTNINILHGTASAVINKLRVSFNIVNAVGVMFHIVNDSDWINTIENVADTLEKGGLFIVGGHFGTLNNLNVQIDRNGNINKRLRSKRQWKNTLQNSGFSSVKIYYNNAYLWINDTTPENNILIATK